MHSTSNLNTIGAAEPATKNIQEKLMRFKNELITEKSAKLIAEKIRQNVALEILQFCNNGLKDEVLHHIIQAIVDRSCLKVFISDNNITDIGVKSIADILSSAPNVISQLHLDKNRITAQGVKLIVQAISGSSNSGLKTLSFTGNLLIKDECIDDIIHFLNEKRTLKSLYLDKCDLSEDGKERLRTAISRTAGATLEI
jgi:RNA-binding protein YhbY